MKKIRIFHYECRKKSNDIDYRKTLDPKTESSAHQNDNVKSKCYVLTADNSASAISFNTPKETNNCIYMLRRRFRFVDGIIILRFSDETLFIHGRNLEKLFDYLCRHRVTAISIADYDEEDSEESYVEKIILKRNSEVDIDEPPTD